VSRSHRDGWVYEEKVDGWRILAYKDRTRVNLFSRNGIDDARRFRELAWNTDRKAASGDTKRDWVQGGVASILSHPNIGSCRREARLRRAGALSSRMSPAWSVGVKVIVFVVLACLTL